MKWISDENSQIWASEDLLVYLMYDLCSSEKQRIIENKVCMCVKVTMDNWGLTGEWVRIGCRCVCIKGWSVLSNDEKVLLQTFIKISTLDLSSKLKKKIINKRKSPFLKPHKSLCPNQVSLLSLWECWQPPSSLKLYHHHPHNTTLQACASVLILQHKVWTWCYNFLHYFKSWISILII